MSESANAADQHIAIEKIEPGQKVKKIDPQNARSIFPRPDDSSYLLKFFGPPNKKGRKKTITHRRKKTRASRRLAATSKSKRRIQKLMAARQR